MIMKGLPLAYNKDLQEGQEPLFDATDTIAGILSVLPAFTRSLKFRFNVMAQAAQTGYLNAMAAATYLTYKGVPFRKAHEIIGNVVRFALEHSKELDALSLQDLQIFAPEFGPDFHAAISLQATLDCHDVTGGTATTRVRESLADAIGRAKHRAAARHTSAEEVFNA
jgi:argininosuccinate lyase